jgi:hypothetical protein
VRRICSAFHRESASSFAATLRRKQHSCPHEESGRDFLLGLDLYGAKILSGCFGVDKSCANPLTAPRDDVGSCSATPNESDRDGEPGNIVEGLFAIARAIDDLTAAIQKAAITRMIEDNDDGHHVRGRAARRNWSMKRTTVTDRKSLNTDVANSIKSLLVLPHHDG